MNSHIQFRLANKAIGQFRAEAGVIWLYDVIAGSEEEAMWLGGVSPQSFIRALADNPGDVTIKINSPGGSVFGAQAMVAAMKSHQGKIKCQIDSLAASAATMISSAAAECVMVPGSMMMIHNAWGMTVGNAADHTQTAALLAKIDGELAKAYAAKAGGKPAQYADLMAAETWFTAEEAKSAGLCDSILETDTQKPSARWNLDAYAKAPAALVAPVRAAMTVTFNDADVAFATQGIAQMTQCIQLAKDVVANGADEDLTCVAGWMLSEMSEQMGELDEWLEAKGLLPEGDQDMPQDKIAPSPGADEYAARNRRLAVALAANAI